MIENSLTAVDSQPNGAGAAAVVAAGAGCFFFSVCAMLGDQSAFFHRAFTFSVAAGPLSGVSTTAIVAWLVLWAALRARWRKRDVALARTNALAFWLLLVGLLLTFPPIADLF
jgi:hypothetical protein